MQILMVALGGMLGSLSRFLVGGMVNRFFQLGPPYGTLVANLTGCGTMGFLVALAETKGAFSPELRSFILIGFLGSYTTFSTYILDSYHFIHQGKAWLGFSNLLGSIAVGLLFLWLGMLLGRAVS